MKNIKSNQSPQISVIMGIFNCQDTLDEAIESILQQTVYDWELIMCDDGSSDNTYWIADRYRKEYPDKIVLLKNATNQGLNSTLNRCLLVARGKYIARMDGDDICSPNRFERELAVFQKEPSVDIVSSDMVYFDETGSWGCIAHSTYPTVRDFLKGTPFCHAPCMVKKEAYDAVGGYTESSKLLRVEDYHLWMKMYQQGYRGKNIHEELYQMRDDRNAYSRRKMKYRINEAYVKCLVVKNLNLSPINYIYAIKPILVGLLPRIIYDRLHKRNLRR